MKEKREEKQVTTKWICVECGDPCFLSVVDECEVKPALCPYHNSLDPNWINPETMYLHLPSDIGEEEEKEEYENEGRVL